MSDPDQFIGGGPRVEPDAYDEGERGTTAGGDGNQARRLLRRGLDTGVVPGAVGVLGVLGGLRNLRRGARARGAVGVLAGLGLLAMATRRARSSDETGREGDVEPVDVVDTAPDVDESVTSDDGGVGSRGEAAGIADDEDASDVVEPGVGSDDLADAGAGASTSGADVGVDQGDVADTVEPAVGADDLAEAADADEGDATAEGEADPGGTDASAEESATTEISWERLGSAALDGQSRKVPAPQRAFNQGYLSQGAEAYWGIHEAEDAVVVSDRYDPIQDAEGVRFVASTEVETDGRRVTVPDEILDHWDDVSGGPTAVSGGDDLVFATASSMDEAEQLLVVPEQWADEVLGEETG